MVVRVANGWRKVISSLSLSEERGPRGPDRTHTEPANVEVVAAFLRWKRSTGLDLVGDRWHLDEMSEVERACRQDNQAPRWRRLLAD